jgi:hypothetical protein
MGVIATLFVLALVYFYNKAYSEEIKKEILKKVKIKP